MTDPPTKSRVKAKKPRPPKKPPAIGPDGLTANQRLKMAVEQHPKIRNAAMLARACTDIAGERGHGKDYLDQRNIGNFLRGEDDLTVSMYVPVLAEVLGVRSVWLQMGIGPMRPNDDEMLVEAVKRFADRLPDPARKQ